MLSKKALFKIENSPNWRYRFQLGGEKFQCSTGTTNRKEAFEIARKAYREAELKKHDEPVANELAGLTLKAAAAKYLEDFVSKWTNANNRKHAASYIDDLVEFFESKGIKRLDQIDQQAVLSLRKHRSAQKKWGFEMHRGMASPKEQIEADKVSAATINRTALLPLKYILAKAREDWGVPGLKTIRWKNDVLLKEKKKARRYVHTGELAPDALPPDYMLFVEFMLASGLRLTECLLRKTQVKATHLRLGIKGGEEVLHPITDNMRKILMQAMSKSPADCEWVFTVNGRGGLKPLTGDAIESAWRRARERGTIPLDLNLHALRHTFAIDLLKKTGNIYLVKAALHHQQIATTEIYARLMDGDLLAGMNMVESKVAERKVG